jgi:hypothetical protein
MIRPSRSFDFSSVPHKRETGVTGANGATRLDKLINLSRFSRKSRWSSEIRFTNDVSRPFVIQ